MANGDIPGQVIYTNKAQCRDCYRCVRVCPVKAIRMHEGQAAVVEERCIRCGTCVRECPQKAKSVRNDLVRAIALLASGVRVAVSVAPSFASVFSGWRQQRLPSALRRLGFCHVGETAVGAYQVACQTAAIAAARPDFSMICSACPAVARYVELYRPALVPNLAPVVSPMLAHAEHLKKRLGKDIKVVFIGPCVAKKAEAERPEHDGLVDVVLTFDELAEWLQREGIDLSACEESSFDEEPRGDARLFPLEGGCVRTAGWTTDLLAGDVVVASGYEEVGTALDGLGELGAPARRGASVLSARVYQWPGPGRSPQCVCTPRRRPAVRGQTSPRGGRAWTVSPTHDPVPGRRRGGTGDQRGSNSPYAGANRQGA